MTKCVTGLVGWREEKPHEECTAITRSPITNNSYVIFVATSCITFPHIHALCVFAGAIKRVREFACARKFVIFIDGSLI